MKSDTFRQAAESKDFSAIDELFAPEVSFRSPVVYKPYEGRDAVAMILGAVVQVFEDFRYTEQVETGDTAALAFSASTCSVLTATARSASWPSTCGR
jgi:SnoaL-like domain